MADIARIGAVLSGACGSGWRGALIALIAGACFPLAFAPFDYWFVGLLSIALLIATLEPVAAREAALRGYLYGVGMYGTGVSWVYVSIHLHGGAPPALAALLVALFVLGLGLIPAARAYIYARWCRGGVAGAVVAFPALWVLEEWFRTWFMTGFPWLLAGYGYVDHALASWAPVTGVLGISAIAVMTAGTIYVTLFRLAGVDSAARAGGYAAIAAVVALWGAASLLERVSWVDRSGQVLTVSAIQGNVDQRSKWSPAMRRPILELYRDLTLTLETSDLVVWPEAAITLFLEDAGPYLDPLAEWARAKRSALIAGILSREAATGRHYNSVVALGAGAGIYRKRTLVPFGEYVPLENLLRGIILFFDLPMSRTEPGAARQPGLSALGYRISTSVCYEVVYPELVRRAVEAPDLLLTVSNDTWFGSSIGPLQHLQMARMRAVENGRYLIRATNNGVSAIVDERGAIRATIPRFQRGVMTGQVQILAGATPFSRWGSWPILVLAFAALAWQCWRVGRARAARG